MGGLLGGRGDPPAAEDCRGVAQSFDSLRPSTGSGRTLSEVERVRSLRIPSGVEGRQDPPDLALAGTGGETRNVMIKWMLHE